MIILGLTGSIGMGKSTAAAAFASLGVPVFDSDAHVGQLLDEHSGIKTAIFAAFPQLTPPTIDRAALGALVFQDSAGLETLECLIYPHLFEQQKAFILRQQEKNVPLVVLDIPLLYEKKREHLCDKIAVVSAPYFIQKYRVLRRKHMTKEKFFAILSRQVPNVEKCRKADFVIHTGLGTWLTTLQVRWIVYRFHRGLT